MKIRIADRLLVALAGLVLLALCASVVAQVFFQVPLTDYLETALTAPDQTAIIIIVAVAAALLIVGVYCVCLLFRRRRGKRGFVMQQTENGELSIAVKAMEGLVHQCVDCHPEMKLLGVSLDPGKDGVTVKLRINLASGVSIPLAVGALQKQIRSYLTSCSGVDVREVRVQVETTSEQAADSPYAVPGLIANPPALLREGDKQAHHQPEESEQDERPIHQRLFGHDTQPATVPAPPAEEAPVEEVLAEEAPAQAEAAAEDVSEPVEAPEPAEALDPAAPLAMAEPDEIPEAERADAAEESTPVTQAQETEELAEAAQEPAQAEAEVDGHEVAE